MITAPTVPSGFSFTSLVRKVTAEERFPIAGVVANRVHDFPAQSGREDGDYPASLGRKLRANYRDFAQLTRRDVESLARLRRDAPAPVLVEVPVLEEPPASLESLKAFARLLAP